MKTRNDHLNKNYTGLRTFILSFWKSILWGIVISVLSLMSGNQVNKINFLHFQHADKLVHFIMYFLLSYFLFEGFLKFFQEKIKPLNKIFYVLIISILFGIIIEIIQITLIPYRSGEFLDFIANITGSVVALVLFKFINQLYKKVILFLFPPGNK